MLSVKQSLSKKSLLLTGATGFLGKVVLERILSQVPDVRRIFLLIRGGAEKRIVHDILQSPLFGPLRSARSDFEQFTKEKLVPLDGDILKDGLGLSEKDIRLVRDQVSIIIHAAGTIDFRDRLDDAMRTNVVSVLQALEVAKSCHNLEGFVHVSSAFVSANNPGRVAEELPPIDFDAQEVLEMVLQMEPMEIEKATPKLLGDYPNAYTFTKAIAENLLVRNRGNIPVSIVRPTIIGSAWKDPIPGWIDSVAAISAFVLYTGVGMISFVQVRVYLLFFLGFSFRFFSNFFLFFSFFLFWLC
jgi:thioester reductase-like protein